MKVIAIDYDGVIVDSAMESLFISHNAYLRLYGSGNKKYFGGHLFTFQNWPMIKKEYKKEIQDYFSLRPYIRGATDYGLIQRLMDEGKSIRNQDQFDRYRGSVHFDFQGFHDAFYEERKRLQQENFKEWLNLEPPFNKVVQGIRQFTLEGIKIFVATSNRREFIAKVFQRAFYDIPIEPDHLLDNQFGEDKSSQIRHIHVHYDVDYRDIYFVDDQLAHLMQTCSLGIHVFLAGWSYANRDQRLLAKRENIPVITQEDHFYFRLKKDIMEK